jgi:hypothetical protein
MFNSSCAILMRVHQQCPRTRMAARGGANHHRVFMPQLLVGATFREQVGHVTLLRGGMSHSPEPHSELGRMCHPKAR